MSTPVHGFMGSKRFVKLKVHMPLSQPLKDWVKVDHPTLGEVLVHYSYEKVTRVCTFCGFLGHELQGCNERQRVADIMRKPENKGRFEGMDLLAHKFGQWMTDPYFIPRPNQNQS